MLPEEVVVRQGECVEIGVHARKVPVQRQRRLLPAGFRLGRIRPGLHPDQAIAHFGGQGDQPACGGVDLAKTFPPGNVAQGAVQPVGPLVVGADQ